MPLTRNDINNNNATEQSFAATINHTTPKNHTMFPSDFVWGTATAAYQIEGANTKDGRGLSVWDIFSHTPSKTLNGDHGDVAIDFYHRYEEDIAMMARLGIRNFRFSISWTRIFPSGTLPANHKGIEFYNKVIDTLLSHNITPYVTLYHWDTPHELEESMGGWLGREISDHFTTFAEVCFKEFGDRVKHWITINEPLSFVWSGYGSGVFAPGRSSSSNGDTTIEPYIASHNAILAHAHVVRLYRTKFQKQQGGVIGVSLNSDWAEPFSDCAEDLAASQRYMEFNLGWYADPIVHGDYPQSMKDAAGDRLPSFTAEEKELIKGSFDFFGLNHYTSGFVRHKTEEEKQIGELGWVRDMGVHVSREKDGKLIGPKADPIWLYAVPFGMRKILNWIAQRYDNPPVLITENGVAAPGESMMPLDEALADSFRVSYIRDYIEQVGKAIHDDGVNVKGYFVWSFMDNFEWADGYSKRFGITYIDYDNGLTRHPKQSAMWYSEFIKEHHHSKRASLVGDCNQSQRRGSFTQVL